MTVWKRQPWRSDERYYVYNQDDVVFGGPQRVISESDLKKDICPHCPRSLLCLTRNYAVKDLNIRQDSVGLLQRRAMNKIEASGWTRSSAFREMRRMYCPHCPMSLRCVVDGGARMWISYRTVQFDFDHLQICCETVLNGETDRVIFYVARSCI
jgi:hypothetical protein